MFGFRKKRQHDFKGVNQFNRYQGCIALKCNRCNKHFLIDRFSGWSIQYDFKPDREGFYGHQQMQSALELKMRTSYRNQFIIYEQPCE